MIFVDTHCHLNFDAYEDDRAAVIARAVAAGVTRIINPGIDHPTSLEALQLSEQYPALWAAVGVHPNSTADFTAADSAWIESLLAHPRVVAVGEIGLDYYWDKSPKAQQIAAFEAQLEIAARHARPVIIHNRDASEDTLSILERWAATLPPAQRDRAGVLHSFSADAHIAERALGAGFYLGFTGPVTFAKANALRAIAAAAPLDRVLVETDGPFLSPHPHRGKRNEPAYIPLIAARLAEIHGISTAELARITTENAARLFDLPDGV